MISNLKKYKFAKILNIETVGSQFRTQAQLIWGSGSKSPEIMNSYNLESRPNQYGVLNCDPTKTNRILLFKNLFRDRF